MDQKMSLLPEFYSDRCHCERGGLYCNLGQVISAKPVQCLCTISNVCSIYLELGLLSSNWRPFSSLLEIRFLVISSALILFRVLHPFSLYRFKIGNAAVAVLSFFRPTVLCSYYMRNIGQNSENKTMFLPLVLYLTIETFLYTACRHRMAHRIRKETKLQPSMLLVLAVPCCSLFSFRFLWAILRPQAV